MSDDRKQGKIKKFSHNKGFGFIEVSGEEDVFLHISNFKGGKPKVGMEVSFRRVKTDKGFGARDCRSTSGGGHRTRSKSKGSGRRHSNSSSKNSPIYHGEEDWPAVFETRFNAGLWFYKFCNEWSSFPGRGWSNWDGMGDQGKRAWLEQFDGKVVGDSSMIKEMIKRRRRLIEARGGTTLDMKTTSRFVTGLGREHPVENGFTWHHTLGAPYLPASGFKGVLRTWASQWDSADSTTTDRIFGNHDDDEIGIGSLVFFDALPTSLVRLDLDVMTPHYSPWYRSDEGDPKPPADWHSPTPIPFLTVSKNSGFSFAVAPRDPNNEAHRKDMEKVVEWIPLALDFIGAGAKTAVGYGRFTTT